MFIYSIITVKLDFLQVTTIYQVHHYILVEGCSPLCCHLTHIHDSFGVIGVDVEYWGVNHTGHVGGVRRGSCHTGICCETNLAKERKDGFQRSECCKHDHQAVPVYLVIDHHVHSAMCAVGRQIAQMEGFVDDALTCKCSITMEQNGHYLKQRHTKNIK